MPYIFGCGSLIEQASRMSTTPAAMYVLPGAFSRFRPWMVGSHGSRWFHHHVCRGHPGEVEFHERSRLRGDQRRVGSPPVSASKVTRRRTLPIRFRSSPRERPRAPAPRAFYRPRRSKDRQAAPEAFAQAVRRYSACARTLAISPLTPPALPDTGTQRTPLLHSV